MVHMLTCKNGLDASYFGTIFCSFQNLISVWFWFRHSQFKVLACIKPWCKPTPTKISVSFPKYKCFWWGFVIFPYSNSPKLAWKIHSLLLGKQIQTFCLTLCGPIEFMHIMSLQRTILSQETPWLCNQLCHIFIEPAKQTRFRMLKREF